jgi:hypothetical protein
MAPGGVIPRSAAFSRAGAACDRRRLAMASIDFAANPGKNEMDGNLISLLHHAIRANDWPRSFAWK